MSTFLGENPPPIQKPGGISWWAARNYAFHLALTPSIGIIVAGQSPGGLGLSLTPSIQMAPTSKSVGSFNLSLPGLSLGIATSVPYSANFNLALPPALSMLGKEHYARSFGLSMTPTIGIAGAGKSPAGFGLSMPLSLNMIGEGVSGLVTLDPATGNLISAGQRYRFAGNNWGDLALNEDSNSYGGTVVTAPIGGRGSYALHLSTHSEIDDYINQCVSMHARVIRAFAAMTVGHPLSVQPTLGSFSGANLEPLDYAIQQCRTLGIKLVLPFVDNYEYFMGGKFDYCRMNGVTPDSEASQFFTNTTILNSFKAHISFVLNHVNTYTGVAYKNDPTILAWESGNELSYSVVSAMSTWTEGIGSYTKAQGAQQLFMCGSCFGHVNELVAAGTPSVMPSVDIFTQHPYANAGDTPNVTAAVAAYVKTFKRAWVNGEWPVLGYGFPTDIFGNYGAAAWTLDGALSTIESPETDGDMFWSLFPSLEGHITVFTVHAPGDNADMITRVNQLTAHATAMPTLITSEMLTDNMTGATGALLSAHTADSGSTYKKQGGSGDGTIQTNRVWFGAESYLVSSGTPNNADYEVTANLRVVSTVQNAQLYVLGRAVWGEASMYMVLLLQFNGAYSVTLRRYINGSSIDLASTGVFTGDLTGTDHAVKLQMAGNQINVFWDGARLFDPAIVNGDVPITGHAGCGGLNNSATTGIHLDSLVVTPWVQPTSLAPPIRRANRGALLQQ